MLVSSTRRKIILRPRTCNKSLLVHGSNEFEVDNFADESCWFYYHVTVNDHGRIDSQTLPLFPTPDIRHCY